MLSFYSRQGAYCTWKLSIVFAFVGSLFLTLWPQIWKAATHTLSGCRYSWDPISNVLGFCGVCNTCAELFSPMCLSFTLTFWVLAKVLLLSTHGSHQHRGENGRRMPVQWRALPEKKRDLNTWLPLMTWAGILSSDRANPARSCTCCPTVFWIQELSA